MAFSLSNWFKGKPEAETAPGAEGNHEGQAPPVHAPLRPVATEGRTTVAVPTAVRTVMPNAAKAALPSRAPSARQAITLPVAAPTARVTQLAPSARKISFGGQEDPAYLGEPPRAESAPPRAAAPGPDVPVILEVGDFLDRLPSSFLRTGMLDRRRKVEFRSSELYSDLSRGRASVPASVIYQKCSDIFSRPVSETEDIEVALPLQKLVEQLAGALQTRPDQVAADNVAEIETPFLQVALEDNARLPKAAGTSAGPIGAASPAPAPVAPRVPAAPAVDEEPPLRSHHRTGQISTITPMKEGAQTASPLVAPTAHSIGAQQANKRPPSTVRASVAGGKIRVSGPSVGSRIKTAGTPTDPVTRTPEVISPLIKGAAAASPSHQVAKKTARIQIPPISLRPAGAPPKAAPPPPVSMQPSPVNIRPAPGASASPTFRSSPGLDRAPATFRSTPPPSIKVPPPSFTPRRTGVVTPSFPAAPPAARPPTGGAPPTPEPAAEPEPVTASIPAVPDDRRIELKLAAILRGLPAATLARDISTVSEDQQISLPFRLVEPQLSTGRVSLALADFTQALPEEHRDIFLADSGLAEVPLPLQEILLNLPPSALSIRADQVTENPGAAYLTPFSQKAQEDAERLGTGENGNLSVVVEMPSPSLAEAATPASQTTAPPSATAPAAEVPEAPTAAAEIPSEAEAQRAPVPEMPVLTAPVESAAAEALPEPTAATVPADIEQPVSMPAPPEAQVPAGIPMPPLDLAPASAATPPAIPEETPAVQAVAPAPAPALPAARPLPKDSVLQAMFMTDDDLDAKTIVKLVCQLPGLDGCTVMFGDGLRLAGNFPENGQVEGFSAMSPPFFKRAINFASEAKLGALRACTIYTETGLLSFFMHDDICVSVRHAGRGFLPGVREKLEVITRELAQMYSATAPASAS